MLPFVCKLDSIYFMNSQVITKKKLPDASGIYFFLGRNKNPIKSHGRTRPASNGARILYIGKATSLRNRVRSYFAEDIAEVRSPLIKQMVDEAVSIDFRVTDSVLEALILEVDLIKKFQPKYNTDEKDDKSFNCVVVTKEDFPRILVVRKKDVNFALKRLVTGNPPERATSVRAGLQLATVFGPFPNGGQLKDAMKIIRRIFPYRDSKCIPCRHQVSTGSNGGHLMSTDGRACFNRQIGLCPGVCTGEISKQEYGRTVRNLKLFFSGQKGAILKNLKKEMKVAAKAREFERAGEIKKTIFALEHIQDVSLIKTNNQQLTTYNYRIEAYDVAHISGTDVVGVMVVTENGLPKKSDYRKFKIHGGFGNNDVASLREVIERRLNHNEWPLPSLFVADGGPSQKLVIEKALKEKGLCVPVVAVTKNERHRPEKILGNENLIKVHERAVLLANSEAHRFALSFHRTRRSKSWI